MFIFRDMKKIGIFYGSTTGNTEVVANRIAENLGVAAADIHDVSSAFPSETGDYDVLIFGASTWGDGDLQDDMHDFLDGVKVLDLTGKEIALFGCGDESMSDTFCNGVGEMYKNLSLTGAGFIGSFDVSGYEFNHSGAEVDGKVVGLLIDNVNHEDMTKGRVSRWCDELKEEM